MPISDGKLISYERYVGEISVQFDVIFDASGFVVQESVKQKKDHERTIRELNILREENQQLQALRKPGTLVVSLTLSPPLFLWLKFHRMLHNWQTIWTVKFARLECGPHIRTPFDPTFPRHFLTSLAACPGVDTFFANHVYRIGSAQPSLIL